MAAPNTAPRCATAPSAWTIVNGRVFVGSASGRVYALSLHEGCAYQTFDADTQLRTALAVSREGASGPSVFFADVAANIYSLEAATGKVLWSTRIGTGGVLGGVEWGSATDG